MAQLRLDHAEFIKRDTTILVTGPENSGAFKRYWWENDLLFIGLPDPAHTVLKMYGQKINLFKLGRMPAQLVVNKKGMVRFIHYGKSMSDIPENKELLSLLDGLNLEE